MSEFDKQKALDAALEVAEKTLNKTPCTTTQYHEDFSLLNQRKKSRIDKYKNKNSIFKRPALPLSRCLPSRARPGHEKNPEKYTKYTLSDVPELSYSSNKTAAFNFLREIEDRKSKIEETSSSEHHKIVFKNSTKLKLKSDPERSDEKRVQGNKFIMPQYVIGEKKNAKSEKKRDSGDKLVLKSQLKLSHLEEEEDE